MEIRTFDKNVERKKNGFNIGKIKQENAGFQSHDVTSHCQLKYKILTFFLEQLLKNLLQKITVLIAWRERKDNKYTEEQTRQSHLSIPRYNLSLLFCIPNMNFLSYIVVEISLTKNVERKKNGINIGKNKQENVGSQSHDTICCSLPIYQI